MPEPLTTDQLLDVAQTCLTEASRTPGGGYDRALLIGTVAAQLAIARELYIANGFLKTIAGSLGDLAVTAEVEATLHGARLRGSE